MDDGTHSGPLLRALTSVRLTTVALFLLTLVFALTGAKRVTPASPSSITAVVIKSVSPRRALLLTLFSFITFTYLLDGLIVFVYWALRGFRQSYFTQWRGVELADVAGFLAFSAVIVIALWKHKSGVDLWLRKRLKAWLILAILLDIAYLVLLILAVRIFESKHTLLHTPPTPYRSFVIRLITSHPVVMQNAHQAQASPNVPISQAFTFPTFCILSLSTSAS
jgi:hypothetical protein